MLIKFTYIKWQFWLQFLFILNILKHINLYDYLSLHVLEIARSCVPTRHLRIKINVLNSISDIFILIDTSKKILRTDLKMFELFLLKHFQTCSLK